MNIAFMLDQKLFVVKEVCIRPVGVRDTDLDAAFDTRLKLVLRVQEEHDPGDGYSLLQLRNILVRWVPAGADIEVETPDGIVYDIGNYRIGSNQCALLKLRERQH
jgi:hypothetical protein